MNKLQELLAQNKKEVIFWFNQMLDESYKGDSMNKERIKKAYDSIQYFTAEIRAVNNSYKVLNNNGLLSDKSYEKYVKEICKWLELTLYYRVESDKIKTNFL